MGSKQSILDATEWVFFQITFFGTKNHQKMTFLNFRWQF